MDKLYFSVFKNIYLFNKIYTYVKNGQGKPLLKIYLSVIFNNRRLFELYYSSYLYNKDQQQHQEGEQETQQQQIYFNNIEDHLFYSTVIKIDEFKVIYNDFKKVLKPKKNNEILKQLIENEINGKEFINYLVKYENIKFDILDFQMFIGAMCLNKNNKSLELLDFVIQCFKNEDYCFKRFNKSKQVNSFKLNFQALINCLEFGKTQYFETIFQLSKDSLVDENGIDIPYAANKYNIKTLRNQLLNRIVVKGSVEMANIYVYHFKNKTSLYQEDIVFTRSRDQQLSFNAYSILVINKVLTPVHFHFGDLRFLAFSSIEYLKPYLENVNGMYNNKSGDLISNVVNLETLQYLIEIKDKFKPPLKFSSKSLLRNASISSDFNQFKFIIESSEFSNTEPTSDPCFTNTSLEIVKFCHNRFPFYRFTDSEFSCGFYGNLEYVKYIVDLFNSGSNKVQLTYRCIDRVSELNYTSCLKYILENKKNIEISREPINNAIKNGNFEMVQLLVDVIPTTEKPTLYESCIHILSNNFYKYKNIILALYNSSYRDILIDRFKLYTYTDIAEMLKKSIL